MKVPFEKKFATVADTTELQFSLSSADVIFVVYSNSGEKTIKFELDDTYEFEHGKAHNMHALLLDLGVNFERKDHSVRHDGKWHGTTTIRLLNDDGDFLC